MITEGYGYSSGSAVANASSTLRRKVRSAKQVPLLKMYPIRLPFYSRKRNASLMEVRKFRTRLSGIVVPHACGRNAQHGCRAESLRVFWQTKKAGHTLATVDRAILDVEDASCSMQLHTRKGA